MPHNDKKHSDISGSAAEGETQLGRLLASMPRDRQAEFQRIGRLRRVPAGTVLLPDGGESGEVGFVQSGILGMIKTLADGRVHIIGLLVPTDVYGRVFDGPASYQVEALTEATVFAFERAAFERILREEPEVERLFMVHLLDELDAAREWLLLIGGHRVVQRVASFLVILSRRKLANGGGGDKPIFISIPIPRTDLAHYLGTRPETLSRAIHELQQSGLIRIVDPYEFELLDLAGLLEVSGQDLILDRDGTA